MIRFFCECGKQLQAHDDMAGKPARCPACEQTMTVPLPGSPSAAVQREEPGSAAPRSERVRAERPDVEEMEVDEEPERERPSPRKHGSGTSGKAIASLLLGLLSLLCNLVAGIPALILAILALRDIGSSRGRLSGRGLAIGGIVSACVCTLLSFVLLLLALLLPAVQKVREAAARAQSMNNFRQMVLAMHNYQSVHGRFPPAGVGNPANRFGGDKPLLSWRVHILPFIGEELLFRQFKLDEPWDSPHNRSLLTRMPKVYNCPAATTAPGYTVYQVFVGPGTVFDNRGAIRIVDIPDGLSNTIMIAEAAQAVPWTKPEDITFDPNRPIKPLLGTHFHGGYVVILADGAPLFLNAAITENTLKNGIIRNDGFPLGTDR